MWKKEVAIIIDRGREEVGLVFLANGYYSYDFEYGNLDDLLYCIKSRYPNSKFIKSENIVVEEV